MKTGQAGNSGAAATWKIFVLCAVSAVLNIFSNHLVNGITRLPLYLDTVFTAAMCFTAGLLPGIITGIFLPVLLIPVNYLFLYNLPLETIWPAYFFLVCALGEIIIICFFYKKIKPIEREFLANLEGKKPLLQSFVLIATQLLVLAALDCVIISILGGITGYTIGLFSMSRPLYPEDTFLLGLIRNNVPQLASEILSRIPINVVDRFIVIFGGYGFSLFYRKWLKTQSTAAPL